jgi:hypothetical protein
MRLVPEGTVRTRLPCRATNEPHPPAVPPYRPPNPVSVFRKLNFASQEWEVTQ